MSAYWQSRVKGTIRLKLIKAVLNKTTTMTRVLITGKHKAKAKTKETRNKNPKTMVAPITTLSRAGIATKRDTLKLNAVPEIKKINP
jgi:hypothetical protein